MPELGAAELLAGAIVVSLNAYVLLAGADFGGGVWDLLATGPRRARQLPEPRAERGPHALLARALPEDLGRDERRRMGRGDRRRARRGFR